MTFWSFRDLRYTICRASQGLVQFARVRDGAAAWIIRLGPGFPSLAENRREVAAKHDIQCKFS